MSKALPALVLACLLALTAAQPGLANDVVVDTPTGRQLVSLQGKDGLFSITNNDQRPYYLLYNPEYRQFFLYREDYGWGATFIPPLGAVNLSLRRGAYEIYGGSGDRLRFRIRPGAVSRLILEPYGKGRQTGLNGVILEHGNTYDAVLYNAIGGNTLATPPPVEYHRRDGQSRPRPPPPVIIVGPPSISSQYRRPPRFVDPPPPPRPEKRPGPSEPKRVATPQPVAATAPAAVAPTAPARPGAPKPWLDRPDRPLLKDLPGMPKNDPPPQPAGRMQRPPPPKAIAPPDPRRPIETRRHRELPLKPAQAAPSGKAPLPPTPQKELPNLKSAAKANVPPKRRPPPPPPITPPDRKKMPGTVGIKLDFGFIVPTETREVASCGIAAYSCV